MLLLALTFAISPIGLNSFSHVSFYRHEAPPGCERDRSKLETRNWTVGMHCWGVGLSEPLGERSPHSPPLPRTRGPAWMAWLHIPWLLLILLCLGDPRDTQNWGSVKIAHQHRGRVREGTGATCRAQVPRNQVLKEKVAVLQNEK